VTRRIDNRRLDDEEFAAIRKEVLASWTAKPPVNLEEGLAYQAKLAPHRRLTTLYTDADANGYTLLNPYGGLAPVDAYLELLHGLEKDGTVDFLPMSIDSHTRTNEYEAAERAVRESEERGRSMLNGFPIIHYGVEGCRKVVESVELPVIARLSAIDARLVAETAFAGGCTALTGSPMASFTCYSRDTPFEVVVRNWQYVERLVGIYNEHGLPLMRDQPEFNIGVAHPPSLSIVMAILNALIAAAQGAPHIAPAHQQQGSILQNVASALVERRLVREYLDRFGFGSCRNSSILVTWVGQFPVDPYRALAILCQGATVASLAGVTNLVCKSYDEGVGLARPQANRESMQAVRQTLDMLRFQRYPTNDPAVREEMDLIEAEVRAVMEKLLELGDGDPVVGAGRAFELGVLDVPYPPTKLIKGRITTAYDRSGAARFVDFGDLPFPADVRRCHEAKLRERAAADGRAIDTTLVMDDILGGIVPALRQPTRPRVRASSR
jgi:methylaspartate mutase epsilon subunit